MTEREELCSELTKSLAKAEAEIEQLRAAVAKLESERQQIVRPKCPICDGVGGHKWNCTLNR